MRRKYIISALIIFTILALDQGLKIWVKTHMIENQNIPQHYDSWWNIHFVENPGMAFSIELPGPYGKLVLSVMTIQPFLNFGSSIFNNGKYKSFQPSNTKKSMSQFSSQIN